jgi:chromosome segregation ATPase
MKNISFIAIALSLLVSGCSTTTETHPTRVSAGDLWYGSDRLDAYLESRRKELKRMQSQAALLEVQLGARKSEMINLDSILRKEQANATQIDIERQRLESEVSQKLTELKNKEQEVQKLKTQMARLESDLSQAKDKRSVQNQMAGFEVEIEDLENEIAVLERSIDRILVTRAKHGLETQ